MATLHHFNQPPQNTNPLQQESLYVFAELLDVLLVLDVDGRVRGPVPLGRVRLPRVAVVVGVAQRGAVAVPEPVVVAVVVDGLLADGHLVRGLQRLLVNLQRIINC